MSPRESVNPTRLSIGDRGPCVDGVSVRCGGDDTASDTEKSYRQLLALNRLHRSLQSALPLKHREYRASEYDFCGDTVIDTVRLVPERSRRSLQTP